MKNEKVDNSEWNWFISYLGVSIEQFTNLNEEELKSLNRVDGLSYDDREALWVA